VRTRMLDEGRGGMPRAAAGTGSRKER
jgi:hypothetical protein